MFITLLYSKIKIKRKDLGVFNPDVNDLKNNRIIIDSCFIIFVNVYSFKQ
jgi:hypothetical protein